MKYLILQNPGHNRVFYNESGKMALAELSLAITKLKTRCTEPSTTNIANIRYLTFSAISKLTDEDLIIISKLSFVFAIFSSVENDKSSTLIPVVKSDVEYIDQKISSILKYQGKTNELFTKMMVNIAWLAGDYVKNQQINLLDPVAGRGTTLYEGLVYGMNSYGIEIDAKSVQETNLFLKKFLENERLKHLAKTRQISGANKSSAVQIHEFEFAKSKPEFKSPENRKKMGIINAPSQEVDRFFKPGFFQIIVGDLPYGIVHGNSSRNEGSKSRNPAQLISNCLPSWKKVLQPGGTIVLAWNSFLVPRKKLSEIFKQHGLEVQNSDPFGNFEHMVDQSIKRDLIIAKKPV